MNKFQTKDIRAAALLIQNADQSDIQFNGLDWTSWLGLPNTKVFIDWLIVCRIELSEGVMNSTEVSHLVSEDRGRYRMIGDILEKLRMEKEAKKPVEE